MARIGKIIGTVIADRYVITDEIGSGGMGRVFSAIPFDDPSQNVAIKLILRDRKLSYEDLLRFQKEAALMSRLHHPNIISFQELGLIESGSTNFVSGGYYIVMEVAQGEDLKEVLKKDRRNLEFFFQIGLQVSSALEYTHSKNIIHRDIKPQNIIVGGVSDAGYENLMVKVLDFGVAKLAEINQFEGAKDIAGTPVYMAPETSDYMDAPVDHRSDLYALGCVLYEILTGRPPFAAGSKEKLAREHAYTQPEPLMTLRPDLPSYINDIVLKLLAKHPDHRYQTAFGLHVDLQRARRCERQKIDFFKVSKALARYDGLKIMTGSLEMIGRSEEFQVLIDNYSEILKGSGRSRLSIVKGEAGSGKSRILGEMKSYLAKHKIRYVSASFSRHENNLPFNALANGFNEYLIKVFKSQPVEAEEIKNKIQTLLGNTAELVARVVPGLKPFIFENIENIGLTSRDDISRDFDFSAFAKAFSDFTRCLTSGNQPIVFVFDDMHWADKKSIELVDRFFSHNNSQRFYLIISYSEGTSDNQYFADFIRKFEKLRRRYTEITAGPLEENDISKLTKIMLNSEQDLENSFVKYLEKKSKGNPLYLVELIRSLVTKDYLRIDEESGLWKYDADEIKASKVLLDSIDLTLNKVIEYDSIDRSVLEVASVIGTIFNFEMLLIDENFKSETVNRALNHAISDYLIVRSENSDELKHLGKAFAFTHNRIRESIKDVIPAERLSNLHRLLALKMQQLLPKERTQSVFTLAHHFNKALSHKGSQLSDKNVAQKAFEYNILAGEKAYDINALVSAERYFKNAYNMFEYLDSPDSNSMKKYVLNKLGDVLGGEKQYSQAVQYYGKFLHLEPTKDEYAHIAYKMIYYGMLNGYIGESQSDLNYVLRKLELPLPRPSRWFTIIAFIKGVFVSFLGDRSSIAKKLKILSKASRGQQNGQESFHPIKLYHLGQTISLTQNLRLALSYHWVALQFCLRGQASLDAVLRTFGDFGLLLGYLGFRQASYNLVDDAISISHQHNLRQTCGYLLAMRTLTLDHYQGKFEDYETNIDEALTYTKFDENQQLVVQCFIFRMHQFLMKGNTREVAGLVKKLPIFLRTRHWLSPRGVSIYLFGLLLRDEREKIVTHKNYLERRKVVGASTDDLFLQIIKTIIFFSMGDLEKSFRSYSRTLKSFTRGRVEFLFPYESDFVMFFLLLFPNILDYEANKFTPELDQLKAEFELIYSKVNNRKFSSRACPQLVLARLQEILNGKKIKESYDSALRSSRVSEESLLEIVNQYWFGQYLLESGHIERKQYIYKVHSNAKKLGFSMLEGMAAAVLKEFHFPVPGSTKKENDDKRLQENRMSRLAKDTIGYTHQVLSGNIDFLDAFHRTLNGMRRRYSFQSAILILAEHLDQENPNPISSDQKSGEELKQIVAYVGSYLAIRSTLFIPSGDAPWNKKSSESVEQIIFETRADSMFERSIAETEIEDSEGELTMVLGGTQAADGNQKLKSNDLDLPTGSRLNTLIPVKYGERNLGVILLENTDLDRGNSVQTRQDLDYFGSYLGLWVRYSALFEGRTFQPKYKYESGNMFLENCSWLDIWTRGDLRGGRESSWFVGLNLSSDEYLVVYCRLNGIEEIREDIAQRVWYQMLAMRNLLVAKDIKVVSWEDLYEEMLKVLISTDRTKRLELISLSFSIISRERPEILSGHFGPSRPFVFGSQNDVFPQDRAIMTMVNGRVLRFWRAAALFSDKNIYLSTHDSSKLDEIPIAPLVQQNFFDSSLAKKQQSFLRYLEQVLVAGHVPRYFVAVTRKSEAPGMKQLDRVD